MLYCLAIPNDGCTMTANVGKSGCNAEMRCCFAFRCQANPVRATFLCDNLFFNLKKRKSSERSAAPAPGMFANLMG